MGFINEQTKANRTTFIAYFTENNIVLHQFDYKNRVVHGKLMIPLNLTSAPEKLKHNYLFIYFFI